MESEWALLGVPFPFHSYSPTTQCKRREGGKKRTPKRKGEKKEKKKRGYMEEISRFPRCLTT